MNGWKRGSADFRHRQRNIDPLNLVRGAALRASIELEQHYPAPAEDDADAINAIHNAGGIWGLPILGNILDEPMQAWVEWIAIYDAVRRTYGELAGGLDTETVMRHEFLTYLTAVRQQLAELAAGCPSGHPEIGPSWLGELHDAVVYECGWSVAETVTHVMALHRRDFPHCVKRDADLVAHVTRYTQALAPLTVDQD